MLTHYSVLKKEALLKNAKSSSCHCYIEFFRFQKTIRVWVLRDHALIRFATRDSALIKTGPQWPVFLCPLSPAVQTVTKFTGNGGRLG